MYACMHARYAQYIHTATNMVEELHTYLYFTYLLWKLIWQLVLLCETLKLDTHTHTQCNPKPYGPKLRLCLSTPVELADMGAETKHKNIVTPICPEGDTDRDPAAAQILEVHLPVGRNSIQPPSPYSVMDWQHEAGGVGDHSISLHQTKHPHRGCWWPYMSNSKTLSKTFPLLPPPPLYRTSMARLCHPIRHFPWGEWVLALTHQKWKALHTHSMCVEYVCVYCGGIVSRECHHEV